MTPLQGFSPDSEAPTPGVLIDCDNFIPYLTGMEGAPSAQTPSGVPVLAGACAGAVVATKLDGSRRTIAGTTSRLYELSAGTWTDVSAATYTGGSDSRWSFAQFGDDTIAANKTDAIQRSSSGAFAAIAGAPKAEVVFSVGSFIMALNVNDGAEKADGWHCCASFDVTDWTEAVATQCNSGRLVSSPGPLTAGLRLGEYAVAYKSRSLYLGQYVGSPAVWDWLLVPGGDAGCVGKEAIVDIDGAHFFVGTDNFWVFEGSKPVPVGDAQVRQWFFDNSDASNLYKTKCYYDKQQNRVWIFYPSNGSSTCDSTLVFHLKNKQWGRANRTIEAVVSYISAGLTYDTWSTAGATYDTLPDISYDSSYWISGSFSMAFFNTSHQLQTLTGNAETSSFTTGDAGDDYLVTLLKEIRLRFAADGSPTSASVETYHKFVSGDGYESGVSGNMNRGKFDVLRAANWHRAVVTFSGPVKVTGINPMIEEAGMR